MLRTSGPPVNPELQRAIEGLLSEDSNFDRTEHRSAHRDHLVRSVDVKLRDCGTAIAAFSRNVSANGIGLITHESISDRTFAVLTISKLTGNDVSILAECRWCKPYGRNWHLSGWQFINLKR
jgi:hypothetical protein